ncbi:MAG: helix-turn-helix domain-containing protein [bacterium]|uniref:Helix-turn-helix domain-containing protein n=1 Tax=Candidatus Methylomirabilis tolerans TaxID=3123416 RepID=A0AAJ1EKE2_9BACT|nr:helix-turn-helix domain-containing protein [Candidatus Methylomirabilis sp.]
MRVISVEQAAERLSVSPRSLIDKRYRLRLGLAAVKIGRSVGFAEADIDRLIEKSRERLPGEGRR